MDERPLALQGLRQLRQKYKLGRVRKPGAMPEAHEAKSSDALSAISQALDEVKSAIDTDETDDMLEESHEPEAAPRGESVLESFSMSGPRKPKALSIDAAVKRPRGRPRKVK